ncbi:MAG: molybdopterin converting factor subunit 1 [Armatimonadetes bacterium]|nr:molybdopterin converting factor subunit 1 [Armatimonadota bacterium]
MKVKTLFFATAKDAVGDSSVTMDVEAGTTSRQLLNRLVEKYPRLEKYAGNLVIAVNEDVVSDDTPLHENDEIAFMPPVSGGSLPATDVPSYRVTDTPLDLTTLVSSVESEECGAVIFFMGTVRSFSRDRKVQYVEYSAYTPLAEKKLREIGEEACLKWPLGKAAIHHRVGRLNPGEVSVIIAVSSPHRAEAYEASRYIIERLKKEVPIWKKEVTPEGDFWIEGVEALPAETDS